VANQIKIFRVIIFLVLGFSLNSQALFEVKDASDHSVFEITNDGIRIFNYPDTLMIISSAEIRANLDNSKGRGLSRSFSVSTNTTSKAGLANVLEITTEATKMREGVAGEHYTDFSPDNIFLGLNAGLVTTPGITTWDSGQGNVFIGNGSGVANISGKYNVYLGKDAGMTVTDKSYNTYLGNSAGKVATGYYNTYVGNQTGWSGAGNNNSFFGSFTGWFCSGSENCLFGVSTGRNIGGTMNVIMGNDAGRGDTGSSYSYNCIMGYQAGYVLDTGSSNVMLGFKSGYSNEVGSGNVFLGNQSGYFETGSNKLYIDNSDEVNPLIYGDFNTDQLTLNGHVGINVAPSSSFRLNIQSDYSGVNSICSSSEGYVNAVVGQAGGGTTRNVGIFGYTTTSSGVRWAGYFLGDINVTGTVAKAKSITIIDHPLDPRNKYLSHSSVESDQMMNIYNGNVNLNLKGQATVKMPDWFDALNTDFRYQLTAIGAPGPNLYISKKITDNSFEISGGSEGMEVSWQVTGIRNDSYAKKNPIEVETNKDSIEKGYYLHPEAFGLSETEGSEYQHMEKMSEIK
jgi:hypothetical protein